jgi:hypothetical protein
MNDPQFVEAARHLGARMLKESSDPNRRLDFGFRVVTARKPTSFEKNVLKETLKKNLAKYETNTEAAKQLIAVGESPLDKELNPSELAAYTMVANLLLNLDETVNKN